MAEEDYLKDHNTPEAAEEQLIGPQELGPEVTPFTAEDTTLDPHSALLLRRNTFYPVGAFVQGANAATAANYGCFFVADKAYEVVSISEAHHVAGTDAGGVTLSVEKCVSGVAPDSGVDLLASAFSLKAIVDTPQFGNLTLTKPNLLLKKGDRLVLKDTGVLTAVSDVAVTVIIRAR